MFKAIRYEKQILIVLLWSVLAFIGYNVLTAEATIEEKDISKMKFVNDDLDDYGLKAMAIEQECKDNGGKWKDNNWCKFDKIGGEDEVEFEHQLEERGLSYYYADTEFLGEEWSKYQQEKYEKEQESEKEYEKYIAKQEDKKLENICNDVDGKWTKDGCETDHDGPKADKFEEKVTELHQQEQESEPEQTVVEDWRNTVEEVNDGPPPEINIPEDIQMNSPVTTIYHNEEDREKQQEEIAEYNERETVEPTDDGTPDPEPEEEEEEEEDDEPEAEEEEEEEPEEDNSDSES